ncbi:hypothetical protein GCT19_28680 [Paraburkholderia sp. CNPSo 3155]|uniref:phosphatase PAP2 family protein n=1 Tax=Paraburkholderia atlantica TaxID=2654982 RepID=UPI00128B601A|nr:phosphatase PAP2 family protein [Paraburkholderia atlantica]MPW09575.1 hypothetical protein [Paraburkholderia atlantica]
MLQHSGPPSRSITACRSRRPQSRQGRQTIGITCACPLADRTNEKWMSGRRDELSEFVLLFMLSGILLVLVATPLPASSALLHFGIADPNTSATVSEFYPLVPAQGMMSMTSFHTTLGIVFIYALRRMPRLLLCLVPLNLMMILSTPTQGGHYLADEFAGLLLSALSIAALKRCMHVLATRNFGNVAKRAVYSGVAPIDSVPRCAWPGSAWIARIARRLMGKRRPEQRGAAV